MPEFVALLRKHNVAVVFADSDDYPMIADVTADFVYARHAEGRTRSTRRATASATSTAWRSSPRCGRPAASRTTFRASAQAKAEEGKRDAFIYMIAGDKVRAPAAAMP